MTANNLSRYIALEVSNHTPLYHHKGKNGITCPGKQRRNLETEVDKENLVKDGILNISWKISNSRGIIIYSLTCTRKDECEAAESAGRAITEG